MADTKSHRTNLEGYKNNHYFDDTYFTVMPNGYTLGMSEGKKMSLRLMIEDHRNQWNKKKFDCPAAFMHDLGYHEIIDHSDNFLLHYNGCATVDIDPPKDDMGNKTWSEEHTINILKTLNDELRDCPHYIMIEPSFSGKGLHLLFGRKQKSYTSDDYFLFCAYCITTVADKLIKLGFTEEETVGTNHMIQSTGQLLDGSAFDLIRKYFYSYKPVYCNENWNPYADWKYENKYKPIDNKLHHKLSDGLNKIKLTNKFDIPDAVNIKINNKTTEDYNDCFSDAHENRLKLCATILRICINNFGKCNNDVRKTALSYMLKFAEILWKDKVSADRYKYCINDCTNKIMRTIRDDCYANYNIVNFLKDKFDFVEIDPNKFHLSDNEYLSNVIEKIPFKTGFNILISGTGTGKTECWKKLTEWNPLNPAGNKVMVCEPYVSIIESKYDTSAHKAHGSVMIDSNFKADLTVTNYNKIIKLADEFFDKIDYLVIDESHLIFAESYRWDITEKFVKKLLAIKDKCKIIFQTATPAYEKQLFNISTDNIFTIIKKNNKNVTIDYKNSIGGSYKLWNAYRLAHKYLDENICDRVFIYNGSGGFNDNYILPDSPYKIGIYHKKNPDTECIEYIDANHKMGDYKILITSCWFGVGHDLHDEDRCCVIVCGNNTYHEEIQCIGRFRDAKKIMCVILPDNYNRHDNIYKSQAELRSIRNKMSDNKNFNSFIISDGVTGHIYDEVDCYLAWYMWMYQHMFNNINTKFAKYKELDFISYKPKYFNLSKDNVEQMQTCKCNIKDTLDINYKSDEIQIKTGEYKRDSKYNKKGDGKYTKSGFIRENSYGTFDIYQSFNFRKKFDYYKREELRERNERKQIEILHKLFNDEFLDISDFNDINEEYPSLGAWCKTVYGMCKHERELFDYLYKDMLGHGLLMDDLDWYRYALRYINIANSDDYDYIENIIVDYMLDNDKGYGNFIYPDASTHRSPKKDLIWGYNIFMLYSIYYLYGYHDYRKIKTTRVESFLKLYRMTHIIGYDDYVKNWFRSKLKIKKKSNFVDYVLSDGTIELKDDYDIVKSHGYSVGEVKQLYQDMYDYFSGKDMIIDNDELTMNNVVEIINNFNKTNHSGNGKIGGKIGGKMGNKIVINKDMPKYKLNKGQQFDTQKELSEYCNISKRSILTWKNKGWISKI